MPALGYLAEDLIRWNKEVFENLFWRKLKIWAWLRAIQTHLNNGNRRYLLRLEQQLKQDLRAVLDEIESQWLKKSRMDAIWDGDQNTRYFHISTTIIRQFNRIEAL